MMRMGSRKRVAPMAGCIGSPETEGTGGIRVRPNPNQGEVKGEHSVECSVIIEMEYRTFKISRFQQCEFRFCVHGIDHPKKGT